jgi:hypothetical protein
MPRRYTCKRGAEGVAKGPVMFLRPATKSALGAGQAFGGSFPFLAFYIPYDDLTTFSIFMLASPGSLM